MKIGMLRGFLPLHYGCAVGGAQGKSSTLGVGLDFRKFAFYSVYKAVGSLGLEPSRGVEVLVGFNTAIGF